MYKLLKLLSHLLQSEYERQAEAEKDRTFWFCQAETEYKLHKQTKDANKALDNENKALKAQVQILEQERNHYKEKSEQSLLKAIRYRDKYNRLYDQVYPSDL